MKNKIIGLGILTITAVQIRNIYLIKRNHESIRVLFDSDHKLRNIITNKEFEIGYTRDRFDDLNKRFIKVEKEQKLLNKILEKLNSLLAYRGNYSFNYLFETVTDLKESVKFLKEKVNKRTINIKK